MGGREIQMIHRYGAALVTAIAAMTMSSCAWAPYGGDGVDYE